MTFAYWWNWCLMSDWVSVWPWFEFTQNEWRLLIQRGCPVYKCHTEIVKLYIYVYQLHDLVWECYYQWKGHASNSGIFFKVHCATQILVYGWHLKSGWGCRACLFFRLEQQPLHAVSVHVFEQVQIRCCELLCPCVSAQWPIWCATKNLSQSAFMSDQFVYNNNTFYL